MRGQQFAILSLLFSGLTAASLGAEPTAGNAAARKAFDVWQRKPWTSDNLRGTPDPPDPFTTENAFPHLTFFEPLSAGMVPGTGRFGVATRPGKIYTFENRRDVAKADLLIDIGKTTYGAAFHPRFAENRFVYVTYVLDPKKTIANGSRLSRFEASKTDPPVADLATEKILLEWPSGGHNGGCLRFGPDSYLYLSTGDGSGIADELHTGQDLGDLLGSILRIDVDHPQDGRPYTIPRDNPFVLTPGARGEIWSFGHRQAWKFSFDRQKRLWAGEVGQDLWEMVYLVERGGNHGWSVNEGSHPFRPERKKGPGTFSKPLVEHSHNDFRSITGGQISESDRLPKLKGAYIYGDYDAGKIWSLRLDAGKVTDHRQLADTQIRIVEIAQDESGEVYFVDFAGGGLHRLVEAPPRPKTKPFPRKLSETGLFTSTRDLQPAPGLLPYSVNAPLWSDGAQKERYLALPGMSRIEFDAVIYPHGVNYADRGWRFPDGAVLVKTFSLEMEKGNPATTKRLETRLLQHRKMPGNDDEYGAQFWFGYTYLWNDQQTDAELLAAEGLSRTYTIRDPDAPGGTRQQTWRYPSRTECALCHTMASKYVLGVTTLQMNKDHDYGEVKQNQLTVLEQLGVFKEKLPQPPEQLPRLVDYANPREDANLRSRAYLHANCAHCHRKWGGGNADFDLQASITLKATKAVNTLPGQGTFILADPRVLVPGDPERSLIYQRMKLEGLGRMPHVASSVVDREALAFLQAWISGLHEEKQLESRGAINPRVFEEDVP
jgi:uncharacterized repeat protein (TIGR03806 family)